ncbi:glycoside hydrolase family 16 protein [Fulvivirga sedimenti]|uniref:Glycoside hydrolase family 16 protein n=1 Tax=Fulvivirga sedimenti TaxID=2879465 RepID=A0A9X1HWN1_9BACT|nr:glycoside hydrolase family 16 protein [Fulvivirga sedimenti]MCA6078745.1 glycoside hydrolase family 16 protein [Fulvivirga sedimenti]
MMVRIILVAVVIGLSFPAISQEKLVWSDEFETDGALDPNKWAYDLGTGCPNVCGWGNNEKQYYTNHPSNVRVGNGVLTIEAHHHPQSPVKYTSARIVTRGKASWKYGRIEVRAKLPSGRGTWPAIWMMPDESTYGGWPRSGEIDIMEHVGFDPEQVHGTVHTQAYNHKIGTQRGQQLKVDGSMDEFHTYGIRWTETVIEFFIDGEKYFEFKKQSDNPDEWPFDQPFHLIMNIAVGGGWGGQKGIDDSIWPRAMEVDYVRVYQ